jgi:plastocyanin
VRRAVRIGGALGALVLLAQAPPALADQEIQAQAPNHYASPSATIDQGEPLTFRNLDVNGHNVTATQKGPDGKALFATPVIGTNQSSFVEGSQYLTTGSYGFICTVHPFMTGTVVVTSAGTPKPRPASDGRAPSLAVKVRDTSLKTLLDKGRLHVTATVDEAASVKVKATTRSGKKTVTLGSGKADAAGAGTVKLSLKLTSAVRKALKGRKRVKVSLAASARDAAGNERSASAARTLKLSG